MEPSAYDHVWRWATMVSPFRPLDSGVRVEHPFSARVGHRCRVVARGRMNSILIEFEDGQRAVCSRNAVRRATISA